MAAGVPGRTTATHRNNRANLKAAVAEHDLPCAECGEKIDTMLPRGHKDASEYGHISGHRETRHHRHDPPARNRLGRMPADIVGRTKRRGNGYGAR